MKTFEIFCEKFSKIYQAVNILDACTFFWIDHPHEKIIIANDVEFSDGELMKENQRLKYYLNKVD